MSGFIKPDEIADDAAVPKYHQIHTQLKKELHFGDYAPDDQFHTIRSLRDLYGVNIQTIRTAVSLLVEDGFLSSRSTSGLFVNPPSQWRRDLLMGTIWFCQFGPEEKHPYDISVMTAIQNAARKKYMNVIVLRNATLDDFHSWFKPETGDGLAVTGSIDDKRAAALNSLKNARYVILGNYDGLPENTPNIRHDVAGGVYQMVTFAAQAGRKRIGVISGQSNPSVTNSMRRAAKKAARETSITYVDGVYRAGEDGYAAMAKLTDLGVDSILVTEPAYFGFCRYVFEHGVKCPEDLFVIRFGQTEENDLYNDVPSASVMINAGGCAEATMRVLFGDGSKRITLPPGEIVYHNGKKWDEQHGTN